MNRQECSGICVATLQNKAMKRFNTFVEARKELLQFWERLSVLDPCNLPNRGDVSWAQYEDLFAPRADPDEDEDEAKQRLSKVQHLKEEWDRYCQVARVSTACGMPLFSP